MLFNRRNNEDIAMTEDYRSWLNICGFKRIVGQNETYDFYTDLDEDVIPVDIYVTQDMYNDNDNHQGIYLKIMPQLPDNVIFHDPVMEGV